MITTSLAIYITCSVFIFSGAPMHVSVYACVHHETSSSPTLEITLSIRSSHYWALVCSTNSAWWTMKSMPPQGQETEGRTCIKCSQ